MSDNNKVTSINGRPVEPEEQKPLLVDISFFVFSEENKPQYCFSVRSENFQITPDSVIAEDKVSSDTRIFPLANYACVSVGEVKEEEEKGPEIIIDA